MARHKRPLATSRQGKETKEVEVNDGYISFSFRYFQDTDTHPAQSLRTWHDNGLALDLFHSLEHMSKQKITELQESGKLALYRKFPSKEVNEFSCPGEVSEGENWGCLRNIGGQKIRVAGFLKNNIFHIVYLDKEHKFYKSNK